MIERISSPKRTIEIIKNNQFTFQKKYGQNFLIDGNITEKIVDSANITKDDLVLEIGPGIGSMTQILLERAREVVAVEIDKALIPILTENLQAYDNLTIINQDILKFDIHKMILEKNNNRPIKIVANLPYYITTPIIMGLFESHAPIESMTVMVQKEVADRMQVGPGTKDYGALSLTVKFYAHPQIVVNVPPSCFMPRPAVASSVIKLTRHESCPVEVIEEKLLFQLIRAAFNQRRKTLLNSIGNSGVANISKEHLQGILEEMNLPTTIRGEALTLGEFALLANKICAIRDK